MSPAEIILLVLLVIVVGLLIYVLLKLNNSNKSSDGWDKSLSFIQSQINTISQVQNEKLDRTLKELNDGLKTQNFTLNDQLSKSNHSLLQQFSISQSSLKEYTDNLKTVTQELTKVGETNKQIQGFASQLQSLENILKNPKQRGILGEYFLETVLKNVLPIGSYEMQYKFANGEIVDAAVFVKDKIIPIDSKFSLENYNRILEETDPIEKEKLEKIFRQDLKNRIEETAKYIRPEENTMEFAFMFIPSEGIYYDLLINKVGAVKVNTSDLITYAFAEKKVIIVSPTSFLAYLQTVMQGLRALQIEESAKKIIVQVTTLKKHLDAYEDNFSKVGKTLGTTVNSYNTAFKGLKAIDKDIFKITGEAMAITTEEVEKPLSLEDSI